ncbi:hypothetical protein ACP4OV_000228 [Aristida adscensionis]
MARVTHRVVFVVTGLVIMVVLHVLMVIWVLLRARRPSRLVAEHADEEGGGEGGGAGLSAEEVGELPCHEFKDGADGGGGNGGGECAVCLEAFRAGDRRRVLPGCGHGFHAACVDSWLRKSRRCPVCRAEVVVAQRKDAGAAAAAGTVETVTESNHANCE